MPRKSKIEPVDMCKVLIGDLTVEEIESVVTYARYMLAQKKRAKPKQAKLPLEKK